jgi:putative ATP-binding cassette transporter
MTFIQLISSETRDIRNKLITYVVLFGLANASILYIINGATMTVTSEDLNTKFLVLFVLAMSIYVLTQQTIFRQASAVIDGIVHKMRMRLTDKIVRKAELKDLETIGKSRIYNHMTQQTLEISYEANPLIATIQSSIMVTFAILYIGTLSITALAVTIGVIALGMSTYLGMERTIIPYINRYNENEIQLFSGLSHLLDGFKEVKLNHLRSGDLTRHISSISEEARNNSVKTKILYGNAYIFAQGFFYVLIGIIVFILPRFMDVGSGSVTQITAVILFIIGPLSTIVAGVQSYTRCNIAVTNISKLEQELDQLKEDTLSFDEIVHKRFRDFKEIRLIDVEFTYYDANRESSFTVGPISMTLRRGETLFLVGGNGSGKSTLLKLLTGLYRPEKGSIQVDGVTVKSSNIQEYRELFSAIFADFHLFDRLYGLRDWDQETIHDLIAMMELADKTGFRDGAFTDLNLSTGQRKRIAMIVSMLERCPINVFDEWAADQDPQFRDRYYYELIPQLKREGRTVFVISHDDRYFTTADRVLKMQDGRLTDLSQDATAGSEAGP